MMSLNVFLKEDGKYPEVIFNRIEEDTKITNIRSSVSDEFANYIIEGKPENQPFIYISPSPIREKNSGLAASIVPSDLSFKVEIQEQLIKFIKEYNCELSPI